MGVSQQEQKRKQPAGYLYNAACGASECTRTRAVLSRSISVDSGFELTLTGNPGSRIDIDVTTEHFGYTGTFQPIKGMFSGVVVGLGTLPMYQN